MTEETDINIFDFNKGVSVSPSDVERWRKEVVETVKKTGGQAAISSGNGMVMASKKIFSHDPDNPVIEVIEITNGYKRYRYPFPKSSEIVTDPELQSHNSAIDKAIEVVKVYFGYPANSDDPHAKPLFSKLQALKK